jgi:hypothetical protein
MRPRLISPMACGSSIFLPSATRTWSHPASHTSLNCPTRAVAPSSHFSALKTPDPDQTLPLEAIREFDAIRLFVQRARAIRSDFHITAANAQTLARICARLDGLPLALELAAARIKLMPPTTLLARLDHRLTLLTGGWRQLPPRQHTLRAACEWSYELLGSAERQLFTSLAVFAGGSDLSAVEAIAEAGALDALGGLVDHNLVLQWEDAAGEARYGMLEILREFGLEQLLASGQFAALHRRQLAYYRGLAEQAEPGLRGQGQVTWLNCLELEHDNLRAALQYAWDTADMESVLRISGSIWRFWGARGHLGEAYRWLEDGLAASRERQDVSAQAHDLALDGAGAVAYVLGDQERGIQHFEQSLAVRRAAGDTPGVARALNNLGHDRALPRPLRTHRQHVRGGADDRAHAQRAARAGGDAQ